MEIRDRIRMVIESHKLTAGSFADQIGVQRSNVSHVLSGRNKPGFEFLEKVLLAFPKVQAHWLLTGKQAASAEVKEPVTRQGVINEFTVQEEESPAYGVKTRKPIREEKKIVKIVTFYSDFSFDSYTPNE